MRLYAIEIGAAVTLLSVKGDPAVTTAELPTARVRPQPRSSADNRYGTQSDATMRQAERPDESPDESSEERGFEVVKQFTFIVEKVAIKRKSIATTVRAVDKLQLKDDALAAVRKLGNIMSQYKLHGAASGKGLRVPLVEELIERYGHEDVVSALVTARQSTEEEGKTMADMWWAQLCELWVSVSKPIAEVAGLLKVGQYESLTQKLEMLKDYIGRSTTPTPDTPLDTLLDTMTTNLGGEEHLVSFIGQAEYRSDAKSGAEELQELQIDKWWDDNIHPANLLQRMHMHDSMDDLLSSKLDTVMKYIDLYNFKVSDYDYSVLAPISARFTSEDVATALVEARKQKDAVTRENAGKLLTQMWKDSKIKRVP